MLDHTHQITDDGKADEQDHQGRDSVWLVYEKIECSRNALTALLPVSHTDATIGLLWKLPEKEAV